MQPEHQKNLENFINSHRSRGRTDEEIRQDLVAAGWPAEYIEAYFTEPSSNESSTIDGYYSNPVKLALKTFAIFKNSPLTPYLFYGLALVLAAIPLIAATYLVLKPIFDSTSQVATANFATLEGISPAKFLALVAVLTVVFWFYQQTVRFFETRYALLALKQQTVVLRDIFVRAPGSWAKYVLGQALLSLRIMAPLAGAALVGILFTVAGSSAITLILGVLLVPAAIIWTIKIFLDYAFFLRFVLVAEELSIRQSFKHARTLVSGKRADLVGWAAFIATVSSLVYLVLIATELPVWLGAVAIIAYLLLLVPLIANTVLGYGWRFLAAKQVEKGILKKNRTHSMNYVFMALAIGAYILVALVDAV